MTRIVVILFCISLLLLSSCAKLENAGYEAGRKIGSGLLGEPIEEEGEDLFCVQKAAGLLQDNVELLHIGDEWYLKEYEFSDGKVDSGISIRYRLGNREGERLTYWYPDNFIERNYVKYTQQQIVDGFIKGDFSFKTKLVLEKTNESVTILTDTPYGKEIESQTYTVVAKELVDCMMPY